MSKVSYCAYRKKQRGGRYVWGVLRQEGRKQQFRTVADGEDGRRKAEELARQLAQLEAETTPTASSPGIDPASPSRRWEDGEGQPLLVH